MGQALDQARVERELTRSELEGTVARLEQRIRGELNLKTRIRRDGVRIAIGGGATLVLVIGAVVLRTRLAGRGVGKNLEPELAVSSFEDISKQLRELRKQIDGDGRLNGKTGPLWQRVVLRGAAAAGAAGGTLVVRRIMDGRPGTPKEAGEAAGVAAGHV